MQVGAVLVRKDERTHHLVEMAAAALELMQEIHTVVLQTAL